MPPRKTQLKRGRPRKAPRLALMSPMRRRTLYNPAPVFTETFVAQTLAANSAFSLVATIDQVPQLADYTGLYQKYRILKAQWIIMPEYTGGTEQNRAIVNSITPIPAVGSSRVVFAINDTPAQVPPASEAAVLTDNGCKIKFLTNKLVITNHPVPNTLDSSGVQMTFKKKYINFAVPNVAHYGVVGWITQPLFGVTSTQFTVYCKLTFQLSDPR